MSEQNHRPTRADPTPAGPGEMAGILHRNIAALADMRKAQERQRALSDRVADAVTRFTGSMTFVAIHLVLFGGWLLVNSRLAPERVRFDPQYITLAMFASVEAIFLSTFVLISQNRMQAAADRRAELDLQVSLLSEHEVTRLVEMVDAIRRHLDVAPPPREVEELKRDVRPEVVADAIDRAERAADATVGA